MERRLFLNQWFRFLFSVLLVKQICTDELVIRRIAEELGNAQNGLAMCIHDLEYCQYDKNICCAKYKSVGLPNTKHSPNNRAANPKKGQADSRISTK